MQDVSSLRTERSSLSNIVQVPDPAPMPTHADVIVEYIKQLGIEYVFGVPGGAIEPFYNALARSERNGGPKAIIARHECGAAFMADGYYRETGKMGVVCSTTGPGATNLITGVSSALADGIPMLVITAQTALPKFGKRALQESSCTAIDTVGMFKHCTNFNTLISHHEQLENKLISAIMAAHRTPNGPVHVSVPSDVLNAPAKIPASIHSDLFIHDFALSDEPAIAKLCDKLAKVDRIAVYIGNEAGPACHKIVEFCELVNAPFVTGQTGKGRINESHSLYRGVYGFAGHANAQDVFRNNDIDLILAVGASLGELGTGGWNEDLLNTKLVHIDSSVEHFTRSPMANHHVCGNLEEIFNRLVDNVTQARKWGRQWKCSAAPVSPNLFGGHFTLDETAKCIENTSPVRPQRLMTHLSKELPDESRLFIDAGNAWSWATHYYNNNNNHGRYHIGMGFGSMTWAVGAAIGSCLANPAAPTVCLVGDGSYLMGAQEITVAQQHQLPIIFMVLNDAALGMVKHGQRLGGAESIGWELNDIDYAALAQAMGINSLTIDDAAELDEINYLELMSLEGPTLIDIRIDRDEVPPMGQRVKGLADKSPITPGA